MDGTNIGPYFPSPPSLVWRKFPARGPNKLETLVLMVLCSYQKMFENPEVCPEIAKKQILDEGRLKNSYSPNYYFNQEWG